MQSNVVEVEDSRLSVPDGGIASFVSDDDESDDLEDFGSAGIAQFPALTQRMAGMGRNGDDIVAHLQTGELVIPRALIDQDPALRDGIFQRLRDMGIDDPERYVVGSSENSINPDTGAPEFFLKKLFKGIKKVIKGVVKVVKKIAPIVLPIIGSMVFGPIYGAALGSGISTLINGGSFKDALKSAAISGITGGIGAGVSGAISGAGFGAGVQAALNPANLSAGVGAIKTGITEGFGQSGIGFDSARYGIAGSEQISNRLADQAVTAASAANIPAAEVSNAGVGAAAEVSDAVVETAAAGPGTFGENIRDAFVPGGKTFGEAIGDAFFPRVGLDAAATQPGFLRTYAPLALAGTAVAAGTGMFDPVPGKPPGLVDYNEDGSAVTGSDLIAANPDKYLAAELGNLELDPTTGQYVEKPTSYSPPNVVVPTAYPFSPPPSYLSASTPGGPFDRPYVVQAAEGGAIFPRRNGGIMPDEGVPGKDSVRAMLMPGEFVMTTNAVRGAGNGDVNNGIRNMYSMMRDLEARGKAVS